MKSFLLLFVLLFGHEALAATFDCSLIRKTSIKKECLEFESDQAVGRLMLKISSRCLNENEFIYHECVAKTVDELTKREVEDLD